MEPTAPDHDDAGGLAHLATAGVAIWLDAVARAQVRSGRLATLALDGVSGVMTSADAFAAALENDSYSSDLAALAATGAGPTESATILAADDARDACDVLRGVFDASGGCKGWVTVPIDPRHARDSEATLRAVRSMRALVDRPNLLVGVPATKQGVYAILGAVAEGISVTATSVFSRDRFRAVQLAYLEGLERADLAGRDLSAIASFVSLPLAPIDAAVDSVLDQIGTDEATGLRGRLAIAHAVLAYAAYEAHLARPRWRALADAGARPQRLVWTSIDEPAAASSRVAHLVARGAVLALDDDALAAVAEDAQIDGDTIHEQYASAQTVLDDAERIGVPLGDLTRDLHQDALARDVAAWDTLLARLAAVTP